MNNKPINIFPLVEAERLLAANFQITKGFKYVSDAQVELLRTLLYLSSKISDILTTNMTIEECFGEKAPRNPLIAPEDVHPVILKLQEKAKRALFLTKENPTLYPEPFLTNLIAFTEKLEEIQEIAA